MRLCLPLIYAFLAVRAFASDPTAEFARRIRTVIPKQGWSVEVGADRVSVVGPETRAIWPVSLPVLSEEKLWSEYSTVLRVRLDFVFQARLSDEEIDELRLIQRRLHVLIDSHIDRGAKGSRARVSEYGAVHLPSYRTPLSCMFVRKNIEGYRIESKEVIEVTRRIDEFLTKRYERIQRGEPGATDNPDGAQ